METTGTYIRRVQASKASLWLTDEGGTALLTSQTPAERGYGYGLSAQGRGRQGSDITLKGRECDTPVWLFEFSSVCVASLHD